ncbi:MAG: sulfatase-like hydrolase/transferase [Planctomycetota bacterium]|nr:sulfatase-like hydrolase/transferase [Planctomycetota bacterium]
MKLVAFLLALAGTLAADERPNVLFLLSDDQRADTIAAHGNPHIRTPSLDRLAARGVSFERAYCFGSNNGAVCVPSRAMILTGRTLYRTGEGSEIVPLMPRVFHDAGYRTFATGKWHNGKAWFNRAFEDGETIYFGGMGSHTELLVHDYDATGAYPQEARRRIESFSSTDFADAAIGFLEGYQDEEPFFLYVAFTAPHDPRTPPEDSRYDPDELPLPPNFLPVHPFDNGHMLLRDERLARWPRTPEIVRQHLADYYGMITQLDAQVGRILEALERTGHADDTIVVFTSDHGLAIGSHGLFGKQNLYEHSMRVPMIVAGPGIPEGGRASAFAYLLDLFPTLCDMTGVEAPAGVEGMSLAPFLDGSTEGARTYLATAYRHVQRAIRDDRYKLIRYPHLAKTQLFDLENDPHETKDLSGERGYGATVARMMRELERWRREIGDPHPLTRADARPAVTWNPGATVTADVTGTFALLPETALIKGEKLLYQPDRRNLGGWSRTQDSASWRIVVVTEGEYAVELRYAAAQDGTGYLLGIGATLNHHRTRSTGGLMSYRSEHLGTLRLTAGDHKVFITPAESFEGVFMNYRGLWLRPVQ